MNDLVTQFKWLIRSSKDDNRLKFLKNRIIQINGTLPQELKEEIDKKKKAIQGNIF
jgi:hypothetical protein